MNGRKAANWLRRNFHAAAAALCLVLLIAASVWDRGMFAKGCDELYDGVLRLHILANSDSAEDQALKLKVRDRVLKEAQRLCLGEGCENAAQMKAQAQKMLPQLQKAAQDELYQNKSSRTVTACVTEMYFDTREYESFTMPAGTYQAVRFTIGEGKGHNWWCVLFPQMCLPAAFETPKEEEELFSRAQLRVLRAKPKYEPRFALLELMHRIEEKTQSLGS